MWRAGSLARLADYAKTFGFLATVNPDLKGKGFPLLDGELKEDEDDGTNQHEE